MPNVETTSKMTNQTRLSFLLECQRAKPFQKIVQIATNENIANAFGSFVCRNESIGKY